MVRAHHRTLIAALSLVAAPAVAQPVVDLAPPPPGLAVQSAADALAADAAVYADRYGVPFQTAMARLRAQEASVADTDAIAAEFRDRLAGIAIEHEPDYRIVVHLTGDAPVADRTIVADGLAVPILFRTGAPATRARILDAIARHQADIRAALIDPPGMGVDPVGGRLLVAVGGDDADLSGLDAIERQIAAIAGVPVHAFVPGRDADLAIVGGGRIERLDRANHRAARCTAGFVVTDGVRTALATAAHCPDEADYVDRDGARMPLTLIGAWGAGTQDVQIHAAPMPLAPLVRAGDALREVARWRLRTSTRAGDFVCHQGITTGSSCAEIRLTDYAPPGDLCAGPCPATWVVVAGPDCARGDSGGPVFAGGVAFGLVKGGSYRPDGRCTAYYYMSTDYLPAGWTLLHQAG